MLIYIIFANNHVSSAHSESSSDDVTCDQDALSLPKAAVLMRQTKQSFTQWILWELKRKINLFISILLMLPNICFNWWSYFYLLNVRRFVSLFLSSLKTPSSQTMCFCLFVPPVECWSFTVLNDVCCDFDTRSLFSHPSAQSVDVLCWVKKKKSEYKRRAWCEHDLWHQE